MSTTSKIILIFLFTAITGYLVAALYFGDAESEVETAITSYEECVEAGYPVMESYPEQCATPDGQTFTREIDNSAGELAERTVLLYHYNEAQDTDAAGNVQCSADGLVAVERTIPVSESPMQDAVNLLLDGDITDAEAADGLTTEFPLSGVEFRGVTVDDDGVLVLHFDDPEFATSGGSCRANILWQQIQATATQFDTIDAVRFAPEELFQP